MSIYNQEILELKKEILIDISNELKNIINFKIKTNTKAYSELEKTISQWDLKINEITKYIEEINRGNYKLNIEENTEDELSILKNELYKRECKFK